MLTAQVSFEYTGLFLLLGYYACAWLFLAKHFIGLYLAITLLCLVKMKFFGWGFVLFFSCEIGSE